MTTWAPWPPPTLNPVGVLVYFYPGDPSWPIVLEVAPEDAGNPGQPDTAEIERVQLPGDTESHVDVRERNSGPWFYRWRHELAGCTAGAYTDWWRADPVEIDDVPPRPPKGSLGTPDLSVSQTSATLVEETWEASASPPPELGDGATELRVRHRLEGEDWPDWGDWQAGTSLQEAVRRRIDKARFVQFQARDVSVSDSPPTAAWTEKIKPVVDLFHLAALGRGPFEDDRARDRLGGEVPGEGRMKAPVYARDGLARLISTSEREVLPDLLIGSGVKGSDGARTGPVNKVTERSQHKHTDTINYASSYQNIPLWRPSGGHKTMPSFAVADGAVPKIELLDPDPGGGELKAVIEEVVSGLTTQTASFSANTHGDIGVTDDDYSAEQGSVDAASDDIYTFTFSITAYGSQNCFDGECWCTGSRFTVGAYINDGSGPDQVGTKTLSADCSDVTESAATIEASFSTLPDGGIAGKEFWMGAESSSGGEYSATDVEWETGGNPSTEDATNVGDYPARWFAYAKDDG